jgi:hypothetical protein
LSKRKGKIEAQTATNFADQTKKASSFQNRFHRDLMFLEENKQLLPQILNVLKLSLNAAKLNLNTPL